MNRRSLAATLAAFTGLVAGTAAAETEITFRYIQFNADEVAAGIEEFNRQNPDINVIFERIAMQDARDQLIRETAIGEGPDVAHLNFVWVKDLGVSGSCLALNELIETHGVGSAGWDDFLATDLTLAEDGETIYGVPFATDTWAMVYNTELLAAAGVDAVPATWDELLEASRQIKAATGKPGFGFASGSSGNAEIWFLANFFMWSNGQALVVEDGQGGYEVGITAEELAAIIDYYRTYLDEELTIAGSLGISTDNDPALIEAMTSGELGAIVTPIFGAVRLFDDWRERNPGEELPFTTAMTPHGSGTPATHLGGQSLCVNAGTEHPEEAWKLVQWLTSWEFFEKYNTLFYPAQQSLLLKRPFPAEMEGFQKQFTEGARSWGPYARGPAAIAAMWNQTARSFGSALIGEQTSMQAAEEIVAFVQDQL